MFKIRHKDERGITKLSWLNSFHTFSFAEYYDLSNMGFGDLRVINDDIIAPDGGFGTHPHNNMEIITVVLEGSLEHRDSIGHVEVLTKGEVQVMTAGTGVLHSEYNYSSTEPLHILQIWILTEKEGLTPRYDQKTFDIDKMLNNLLLIVSRSGESNSLIIHQDAKIYQSILEKDKTIDFEITKKHKYWIQVAKGSIKVNSHILEAGDGLAIENENVVLEITGNDNKSNFLLFQLKE